MPRLLGFLPAFTLLLPLAAADVSPLVVEGIIEAPVSEVWKVFSTPEGYRLLGPAQCDMDFRVGGLIRSCYSATATLGDPSTIQNRILSFEPGRMVSFRIDRPPQGFPFPNAWQGVWTVATFTDLGGRTGLRLAMMGYTADEESQRMREFFKSGNAWALKKLQQHFK